MKSDVNAQFTPLCKIIFKLLVYLWQNGVMHPTMTRLFEAAQTLLQMSAPADLARLLEVSNQVLNNWQGRGISAEGAITAQSKIGCSAEWIFHGTGPMVLNPFRITRPLTPEEIAAVQTFIDFTVQQSGVPIQLPRVLSAAEIASVQSFIDFTIRKIGPNNNDFRSIKIKPPKT